MRSLWPLAFWGVERPGREIDTFGQQLKNVANHAKKFRL
jgi:hypothetical protein